jgi:hypothetical protein
MVRLGSAVLVLGSLLLVAAITRPERAAGLCEVAGGPATLPGIPEASGLAVGRRAPGVLWSHNDSGNASVLFAFDAAGAPRGRVRVPIQTIDWEDVSAASCPSGHCLYIADIGDNGLRRRRVQVYVVPEPAPGDAQTAPPEMINLTYPDGPHNAEALFVVGGDLFIVTKDRIAAVFRASGPFSGGREAALERIGQLGLEAVTDAEASRDEKAVVVRTSHEAVLYRTADIIRGGNVPFLRINVDGLREAQGEGVAIDGSMLYLSSERSRWNRGGSLIALRCTFSPAPA